RRGRQEGRGETAIDHTLPSSQTSNGMNYPYISPQSTYGYARHLGSVDRSSYVLPRTDGTVVRQNDDITLSPISFHIPRINSGENYSPQYAPRVLVNLPPVPPSVVDVDEYYGKQDFLPQGAILADSHLVPAAVGNLQEKALNENTALSFQTILFALLRYPALICVFFAASSLWGRGKDVKKVNEEWSMSLASFSSGSAILLLSLLLLSDHRNCYLRAKILVSNGWLQAWSRHALCMAGVGGAVVTIVFAALSISPLQNVKTDTCTVSDCLSASERMIGLAVMIGASSLILMLALFALVMGCVGVYQMKWLLEHEK
ncbi:hypothetical protein PFISCL1PPCAC_14897, partial [Pristionchus fissidentatus]